jgi:hypothetical protein
VTGRALKHAETIDGALVPALTEWDKRVLDAVPTSPEIGDRGWSPAGRGLDPWMIARAIRTTDVAAVRSTLHGLHDRHLVTPIGYDTAGRRGRLRRWTKRPLSPPGTSPDGVRSSDREHQRQASCRRESGRPG